MANPGYPRARRLAETIKRLVGEWLELEAADTLAGLVTVTDVRVTPDLRHAKVFFTVLAGEDERAGTQAALAGATSQARTYVARRVRLRYAPKLEFVPDEVPGQGARIDRILAELEATDRGTPADTPDQERSLP